MMNRETGTDLTGLKHLKQSIIDILTTPIGSRVMRRDYGSHIFFLVDKAANPHNVLRVYVAVAEALERWEPRFILSRVTVDEVQANGRLSLTLEGIYLLNGEDLVIDGITL